MGSGCSSQYADAAQDERNKKIEKDLLTERRKKVLKLLLLGPGESGKSTTLKQIRIIHDQGFSDAERAARKYIIYENLISGCASLIREMETRSLMYEMPDSFELATEICKFQESNKHNEMPDLSLQIGEWIQKFLMDPAVQQALYRMPELGLDASAVYFLEQLPRIVERSYVPSTEDILKSRVPTTGVVQFQFLIKTFMFRIFDVGGQKAQRRKWIHIFDDVHAVLFITSLSEYNQMLAEDASVNRMRDSIELFSQICNNQWFSSTAMILFLNKIDLFKEKIKIFPLTIALPKYKDAMEYRPCVEYIKQKFKSVNKNKKRSVYMHETCATDTSQIQVVIDSVIDVVIQQTMQKVGIQ